jgi:aspartate kinase
VKELNFDEAAEISYFLTRIIHPTCIMPAKLANIPVRLMSIGNPQSEGTLISNDFTQNKIKAIASKDGITSIRIKSGRMLMAHGFLRKVFEIFENHKTAIDMVTTSEIGVSITIDNDRHIEEIMDSLKRFGTVSCQKGMTIVCIIGDLSCQNIGMQSQIIESLKEIPTHMISYGGSPFNSSFLINTRDKEVALNSLNNQLF